MPTWKELEEKKGRQLVRLHDHIRMEVLFVGIFIMMLSGLIVNLSSNLTLDSIGFVLFGMGITLIVNETINAVDRKNNYVQGKRGERRLFSVSEQSLSNSRIAAQLATCLYYLCFENDLQHTKRAHVLSTGLGISDILFDVLENARSTPIETLGRYLPRILAERKGSQVEGAYSASFFMMILARSNNNDAGSLLASKQEKISAVERVVRGLRKQDADDFVIKYMESALEKWLAGQYTKENMEIFSQIIRLYLSLRDDSDLPVELFEFLKKQLLLDNKEFYTMGRKALNAYDLNSSTGSIHIESGSDTFASLTTTNKKVIVKPHERIRGTITICTINELPELYQAPFIMVPTWGDRRTNFVKINDWIHAGKSIHLVDIDLETPNDAGEYYLLFAFDGQTTPHYVASATDWRYGYPLWGDKNDLVDLNSEEIEKAQRTGQVNVKFLFIYGYGQSMMPLDAIKIVVS